MNLELSIKVYLPGLFCSLLAVAVAVVGEIFLLDMLAGKKCIVTTEVHITQPPVKFVLKLKLDAGCISARKTIGLFFGWLLAAWLLLVIFS